MHAIDDVVYTIEENWVERRTRHCTSHRVALVNRGDKCFVSKDYRQKSRGCNGFVNDCDQKLENKNVQWNVVQWHSIRVLSSAFMRTLATRNFSTTFSYIVRNYGRIKDAIHRFFVCRTPIHWLIIRLSVITAITMFDYARKISEAIMNVVIWSVNYIQEKRSM